MLCFVYKNDGMVDELFVVYAYALINMMPCMGCLQR